MKPKKPSIVALLLAATALLNGCQSRTSLGKCITPPVTWEFPVMATITTDSISDLLKEIPPSGNWQAESVLPQKGYVKSLVTRSSNEIWIIIDNELFIYSTNTQKWEKISHSDSFPYSPKNLYVANDGTLWGVDLSGYHELKNEQELPLLMSFNETTNHFEFVKDIDSILNSRMDVGTIIEPAINRSGEMWMILVEEVDQEYLYNLISFNPVNLQVNNHLTVQAKSYITEPAESRFGDMAITPDDKVWILDYGKGQFINYDPLSGETNIYQGFPGVWDDISSEDLRHANNLYVDRMGRIWVDDRGFLDFSNTKIPSWHKIIRSPVFIGDARSPENQYGWGRPNLIYQSSNGIYWFSDAGNGMVNLDPVTGEWCKFTTGSSPIAEDSQGNLWIAVFGKLYKYKLTQ